MGGGKVFTSHQPKLNKNAVNISQQHQSGRESEEGRERKRESKIVPEIVIYSAREPKRAQESKIERECVCVRERGREGRGEQR